ncbi:class I SAM-dependent methyltransferase [Candidatus Omnitrophota bacterium]
MKSLNKEMHAKYETISQCNLCGSSETKVVDKKGHIVQCKRCGLRFVSLRPSQDDISKAYDWSYVNSLGWGKVDIEARSMYKRRADFLNKFIQKGKILDVAAGLGEFLSHIKRTNRWECFGTETSRYAVEYAKKELDIKLSFGQFEDLCYPESFFDAVCFWHALEHLPYPSKAIEEAARVLKENSFLFIAVPNDSWLGRPHFFKNALKKAINRLPMRKKLKLKKMYPEIDEEGNKHLFYFTPRTLTKLLETHGFEIKKYSVDYDYGKLDPKLEKKYRFDLLFCRITKVNLSNAVLIAAQKRKDRKSCLNRNIQKEE